MSGVTRWWPAHPRSRGENFDELDEDAAERGSSPLTRGKPQRRRGRQQGHWLIPAHAGKTSIMRRAASRQRAHPRSRGENSERGYDYDHENGSSPLTRGKRIR